MREIAPGLWQLRSYLGPNLINMYYADGVLFDAATKWARKRVLRELGTRELKEVALTHAHADHQGVAKALCDEFDVPLACPEADVDAMEGREPMSHQNAGKLPNRFGAKFMAGPPRKVDRVLREGDEVAGFRVVNAPGHAPGEVIFFRDSDRVAICGDVITTIEVRTGMPGVHMSPGYYTWDMEQAKEAVVALADLRPSLVCPGHGRPLSKLQKLDRFIEKKGLRK